MRKTCLFFCLIGVLSCSAVQEPVFKKMKDLRVEEMSVNLITLTAVANYYNPNPVKCKLIGTDIGVFVDDKEIGRIQETNAVSIASNSDFDIPVKISFPPKKLLEGNGGLLSSVITAVLDKKVDVKYDGFITLDFAGVKIKVPVNYEEKILLKES